MLVTTLKAHAKDRLDFTIPDQGLHMIARMSREDIPIAAAAKDAGIGARALSPMYIGGKAEQGLVLGFSAFTPDIIRDAAIRLCTLL